MRAINKIFGSSNTVATFVYMRDGEMVEETIEVAGNKSEVAIKNAIRKKLNTQNFFLKHYETKATGDEQTLSVDGVVFYDNSEPCIDGESYDRSFVTSTFKITHVAYMSASGIHECKIIDNVSEAKARRTIAKDINDDNILITGLIVKDERRYMPKDKFIELAKESDKE